MWLLVVVSCIAGEAGPQCGSGISSVYYPGFEACEDAAVRSHDRMRAHAEAEGLTVLLLDTRCIAFPMGDPA